MVILVLEDWKFYQDKFLEVISKYHLGTFALV